MTDVQDKPVTVLLVDDEDNILRSLSRLLMDEDFELLIANSGEKGLEVLADAENVGLIVSDQRMPGMNGAEFLSRSREIVPNALRILLTGYSDINATIDAINKGGAYRYISKPWDDDELVQIIRDAVDKYTAEEEKRRFNAMVGQQNDELEEWNENLKKRLLQSTASLREKTQALSCLDEKAPLNLLAHTFDSFFEVVSDRNAVHARSVGMLVTDVARKMGMDAIEVSKLRLAALLHDAGKFGTMSEGLHKHVEDMSESELIDYRQHPERGYRMFHKLDDMQEVAEWIRLHHEAYNGGGFPDGLKEEEIPLGARLIAIADCIDQAARSVSQMRAEYAFMKIKLYSETILDPKLIPRFFSITRLVYYEGKRAASVISEVEVDPKDLVAGMVLARDVLSKSGVLLLQGQTEIDEAGIMLVRRHYKMDPPDSGVFVRIIEG